MVSWRSQWHPWLFSYQLVQIIKPLPQPPPQCKALYDFEVKDKEADKDCLPFAKDDVLTVIRRVDENWAEGMLADKIGIFPISYVEFNTAAKQLIELDKPSGSAVDSGEGTSGAALNNSVQKHTDTKKNTKKTTLFYLPHDVQQVLTVFSESPLDGN